MVELELRLVRLELRNSLVHVVSLRAMLGIFIIDCRCLTHFMFYILYHDKEHNKNASEVLHCVMCNEPLTMFRV